MKVFALIFLLMAGEITPRGAPVPRDDIPDPAPISRKLSVTHLSKQLKKVKLSPKDQATLAELNARIQLLSESDRDLLERLVIKTQSPDPEVRKDSWRKIQSNRRLMATEIKAAMGVGGVALGLFILGFFKQGREIKRLKKKWAKIERKLFYSQLTKQNEVNSLGSHVASLVNQASLFADHMYSKTSELSNFVDGRPIF